MNTKEEIINSLIKKYSKKQLYEEKIIQRIQYAAMEIYSDQQNKELKEIVKELQKDFVLKLEENDKEYSKWLTDNCGERGKDESGYWWIYKTSGKPLNEDQIYKKYLQSLNK